MDAPNGIAPDFLTMLTILRASVILENPVSFSSGAAQDANRCTTTPLHASVRAGSRVTAWSVATLLLSPRPTFFSSSATTADLEAVLMYIFRSSITRGEERDFGPGGIEMAKGSWVGRRLFAIEGNSLCVSACEGLRGKLSTDKIRSEDTRALEFCWTEPVIPGWYP